MSLNKIWTERYRPTTIDEYVFADDRQRAQINTWIKEKEIPSLLLTGSPGVGKTTLAKILINAIGIEEYDVLEINASRDNGVDFLKERIMNFIQMMPFGKYKVVLLDEADFLSIASQAILRGVLEEFSETARFILTANFPHKIIPALHSRTQGFHIERLDQTEFTARAATILVNEEVEFDLDTLDSYVKLTYPDMRKCINLLQQNSTGQTVLPSPTKGNDSNDYRADMVELFKAGNIAQARKLICSRARPEEFEDIYSWLYRNLDLFGKDEDTKDSALLIIKQGLVDHTLCADSELNFAATMVKLARLQNS